jgi:hypothetical protein
MIPPDNRLVAALARENMITERNHFYTAAEMRNPALIRHYQKLGLKDEVWLNPELDYLEII